LTNWPEGERLFSRIRARPVLGNGLRQEFLGSMLDFILLADAEDDLVEAYNSYESREFGLGHRFRSSVQDGLTLIRQYPEIFPVCASEFRRALISKFPFEIIYEK
jgi:hypothetical protein